MFFKSMPLDENEATDGPSDGLIWAGAEWPMGRGTSLAPSGLRQLGASLRLRSCCSINQEEEG